MKKSIFMALALTTAFTTTLLAQRNNSYDARMDLRFGLKAGFNYANVWDQQGDDFVANPRFGFAGGVFVAIPIVEMLGFQPEILFSQKGFQGAGTILGEPYSFSRRSNYIDVPLQLAVKPTSFLTLLAGPQYSWLISETNEYNFFNSTTSLEEYFDNQDLRRNTLGFITGLDLHFNSVTLSGRMGWDLQANHEDGTSETPRYKNRWLQFTIGVSM